MLLRAGAIACLLCAGCGDDAPPVVCVVGDLGATPELELVYRTTDGTMAPLVDGAELPLITPPQGGEIILVGMRVRNVDLCGSTIQAALRDTCDNQVLGLERRPVAYRIAADGFAEPSQPQEISDFANLALCPNASADRDLDGHEYQLELRFYPASGDFVERIVAVTLNCQGGDEFCRCECDADYELGEDCPPDLDAGVECPP